MKPYYTPASLIRALLIGLAMVIGLLGLFTSALPPSRAAQPTQRLGDVIQVSRTPVATATVAGPRPTIPPIGEVIILDPFAGSAIDSITVNGLRWPAGERVLIYLSGPGGQEYAIATTIVDAQGGFAVSLFVPAFLADQPTLQLTARTLDGAAQAQALYTVVDARPTAVAPTPQPNAPTGVISAQGLNVRSGPGVAYPRVGLLTEGQEVNITGQNGGWWRISYGTSSG
ncbi:MAG TPA: SH3 domain-containing protein, partial [Anaerolineae bacterium]|nr:SH3 domain-containing protein [Anaerolineae bacterium]